MNKTVNHENLASGWSGTLKEKYNSFKVSSSLVCFRLLEYLAVQESH